MHDDDDNDQILYSSFQLLIVFVDQIIEKSPAVLK